MDGNGYGNHTQRATALVTVFRGCSCLQKVSLKGDSLRFADLDILHPYGHLFHELEFGKWSKTITYARSISNLLVTCNNLRWLLYEGQGSEFDSVAIATIHLCPLLEELRLSSFAFNPQEQVVGTALFSNINRDCKHFRFLTMVGCDLSSPILRSIAGMDKLKELSLCTCRGLTEISELTTMNLRCLTVHAKLVPLDISLKSFVGSNISRTLEKFLLYAGRGLLIDEIQLATSLASCHNLQTLKLADGDVNGYEFGGNGLAGLQAIASGCPLLTSVSLYLTADGIHYLGTHFANLKCCTIYTRINESLQVSDDLPSIKKLQTLYPAVQWSYC